MTGLKTYRIIEGVLCGVLANFAFPPVDRARARLWHVIDRQRWLVPDEPAFGRYRWDGLVLLLLVAVCVWLVWVAAVSEDKPAAGLILLKWESIALAVYLLPGVIELFRGGALLDLNPDHLPDGWR